MKTFLDESVYRPNLSKFLHVFGDRDFVDFLLQLFLVHHTIDMDLQNKLRSLRQAQVLWAQNLWKLWCAGFRHSAGLHVRVTPQGAACRLNGAWRCAGCTECSQCVVGYIGEEDEWQVRQPRMGHGSHQITTLISAHKDDNAIIEPSAPVCALRACEQTVLHKCVL